MALFLSSSPRRRSSSPAFQLFGMESPWSPGDEHEPDYHLEELEGFQDQAADDKAETRGEMELFIVPPDPPRGSRHKRVRSKGKAPPVDEGEGSGQAEQHNRTNEGPTQPQTETQPQPQAYSSSSKSKLKSKVLKDFTKISKDGANVLQAECNHCKSILSAASKNGTSHLLRHLDAKHKSTQSTVNNYFLKSDSNDDGTPTLRNSKFDLKSVRTGIFLYLVGGSHPFTTVEEHGFRTMMAAACPQYKPIGRHTIKREIMAMFVNKKEEELMEIIHSCPGRVSFTSDNWKSEVSKHSYICITCHYIDAEWKLNKRIIWFKKLDPPYNGASIANGVHLALREWNLDNCMTLDNAAYNDRMIDCLRTHLLPKGGLPLFGLFFQIRCCAHILNLVVQAGLTLIDAAVRKLRDDIMYLKASGNRLHKFYNTAATIFNLEKSRRLKPDMPISWNSTYTMLETCIYFRDVLHWYAERDNIFESNFWLSEDEWAKVSHMHQFLVVFFKVTKVFSGTKYPTANLYFMNVNLVHSALSKAGAGINNYMAPMLKDMREKFDKYWSDYSIFLSCAAVLGPRIKLKFLEYCYSNIYAVNEAHRHLTDIRSTMTSLFEEYRGDGASVNENLSTADSS